MSQVGTAIEQFLSANVSDITLKKLTHMVALAYYDKMNLETNQKQLSWHCDQRYCKHGSFMHSQNSQIENTATCILTVGETRVLQFRCVRDSSSGPVPINSVGSTHSFHLSHGSLFVMHPADERKEWRFELDDGDLTYFQHGNVIFGKDGLSIGLVFRVTSRTIKVWKETGMLALSDTQLNADMFKDHINKLNRYMNSSEKRENDDKLEELARKVIEKHFN